MILSSSRMGRSACILLALLSACSEGAAKDLQYIKQARSIGAEWALVNDQAHSGRVTTVYVQSMHHWLHDSLQTASSSLTQPQSEYGREISQLLAEPADAPPDQLRSHVTKLKQIEDQLESA